MIIMDRNFLLGVAVGVVSVYAWHRWVRPMPSKASG